MRFPVRCALVVFALVASAVAGSKGPKVHTVAVGKAVPVLWTDAKTGERLTMTVRPLLVDGKRKNWIMGDTHEVTDHSFTALEVQHLNDALPGEKAHFLWQATGWLLVDKAKAHVSDLHFTGYDPQFSGLSWFRDYAAYCAVTPAGKALNAEVVELGSRRPVARKKLSAWPRELPKTERKEIPTRGPNGAKTTAFDGSPAPPVCGSIAWDRDPVRATFTAFAGEKAVTLDVSAPVADDNGPIDSK